MPDDIQDTIETVAAGPARVSVEGRAVDAQRLGDLIEADKYLAAKAAAERTGLGLRTMKLKPPAA